MAHPLAELKMMMRTDSIPVLWSVAVLAAITTSPTVTGQKPSAIKSAGKVFQNRCASCHIIPDPAVATDRSWIDQVNRTS